MKVGTAMLLSLALGVGACSIAQPAPRVAEAEVVDYGMAEMADAHGAPESLAAYSVERTTDELAYKASISQEAMAIPALSARLIGEIEHTIEDYAGEAAEMKQESPDVFNSWAYEVQWLTEFNNEDFLNLRGNFYEYSGGAHPNWSYDSILWDRRSGREVELSAFFEDKRAGLRAVSEAAKAAFFEEIEHRGAAPESEPDPDADPEENAVPGWALDGLKPSPDNYDAFVLVASPEPGKAGGVIALFSPYELGPYVWGGFELFVPASAFRDHLTTRYAALFGADAPQPAPRR